MIRKDWITPWLVPLALVGTALCIVSIAPRFRQERKITRDVAEVARAIQERYLEEVDPQEIRYRALEGMVDGLRDPYSDFYRPGAALEIMEDNEGKFGGVGIIIQRNPDDDPPRLIIVSTIEGQPGFRAGLRPGDWITAVDGQSTEGLRVMESSRLIKGEAGTEVTFTIERPGRVGRFDVTVVRGEIAIVSVRGARIIDEDAGIGYVRLIQFQENTLDEFDEAVARLQEEGLKALVLDLRSNPGGVLTASLELAGRFLPVDAVVVSTVGRNSNEEYRVKEEPTLPAIPLVILVNEGSASASEIVAGAIQDHKRGLLLGARTFGKGSVQSLLRIGDDGSLLKITTQKYQTPNGRIIHREKGQGEDDPWGLIPDVAVPLELTAFQKIRISWGSAIPGLISQETEEEAAPADVPADAQLDEALRILRDPQLYGSLLAGDTPPPAAPLPETAKGAKEQ